MISYFAMNPKGFCAYCNIYCRPGWRIDTARTVRIWDRMRYAPAHFQQCQRPHQAVLACVDVEVD
jgi:hypothetical protein